MTATDFDALAHPDKLNIGCGWDHREGYLNVDFLDVHGPDLVADVRDLHMLPSGHYNEIVAQDILEHLERAEIDPALEEWARVLAVGGRLILRVPDLLGVARLLTTNRTIDFHHQMIHALLGTQAYNGDYHHATFTELTLRDSLHRAGFIVEELTDFNEWLFDVVAVKVDDPGEFDPGPLPYLDVAAPVAAPPAEPDSSAVAALDAAADASVGRVDRAVTTLSARLPDPAREAGQKVWRPLRSRLSGFIDRAG